MNGHGERVAALCGQRFIGGFKHRAEIAECAGGGCCQRSGLTQGLARIAALDMGDALGIGLNAVGDGIEKTRPFMRFQIAPRRIGLRPLCPLNRALPIRDAGTAQHAVDTAVSGKDGGDLRARALFPFTGDEQLALRQLDHVCLPLRLPPDRCGSGSPATRCRPWKQMSWHCPPTAGSQCAWCISPMAR